MDIVKWKVLFYENEENKCVCLIQNSFSVDGRKDKERMCS